MGGYIMRKRLRTKAYLEECRERKKASDRKWAAENKDKKREYDKQYVQNNKGKINSKKARRNALKLQATPTWLTKEQIKEINDIYQIAQDIQWLSEEKLHVDHIIPLQGKEVRGLHVPWNLQIIPQSKNCKKGSTSDSAKYGNGYFNLPFGQLAINKPDSSPITYERILLNRPVKSSL